MNWQGVLVLITALIIGTAIILFIVLGRIGLVDLKTERIVESAEKEYHRTTGTDLPEETTRSILAQLDTLRVIPEGHISELTIRAEMIMYDRRDSLLATKAPPFIPDSIATSMDVSVARIDHELPKPRGYLKVTSDPVGAKIIVDEVLVGYTGRKFVLRPGRRLVSVYARVHGMYCKKITNVIINDTTFVHCSP